LTKKENEELSNKSMSPCFYYLLYNPKIRFLCSRIKKKIKLERNQKAIRGERWVRIYKRSPWPLLQQEEGLVYMKSLDG
jgi:hypothetical protein